MRNHPASWLFFLVLGRKLIQLGLGLGGGFGGLIDRAFALFQIRLGAEAIGLLPAVDFLWIAASTSALSLASVCSAWQRRRQTWRPSSRVRLGGRLELLGGVGVGRQ